MQLLVIKIQSLAGYVISINSPTTMPESTMLWPLILMLGPQFILDFGFPCMPSLDFLMMHCTLSSRFSPCFFSYPPFHISMPSYKLGPGKLDYHSNGIFQILSSYGRFGAEQRHYHLKSASSLITGLSGYSVQACFALQIAGWHYWLILSYFIVSLKTINSAWTQGMGIPWTVQCKIGWRVTADIEAGQVMKGDGEFCLESLPICSHAH